MKTVTTGCLNDRTYEPGACQQCGYDDEWEVDGRGNVLCGLCQRCPDCGIVDAYSFHEPGCAQLETTDHEGS